MIIHSSHINSAEVGRHCACTLLEAVQKKEEKIQNRIKEELEKCGAKGGVNILFNELLRKLGLFIQYYNYSGIQILHTGYYEEEIIIKLRKVLAILESSSRKDILWSYYSNDDLENMSNRYTGSDLARELLQWRKLYPGITRIIKPTIHEVDKETT